MAKWLASCERDAAARRPRSAAAVGRPAAAVISKYTDTVIVFY